MSVLWLFLFVLVSVSVLLIVADYFLDANDFD